MKKRKFLSMVHCLFFISIFSFKLYTNEYNNDIFEFIEIYSNLNFSTPKTAYKKDDFLLSTMSLTYGTNINFKCLNLKYFQKAENTTLKDISKWNCFKDFEDTLQKPAWSFMLNIQKIPFIFLNQIPLKIYSGTLSYSESASKLRNLSFSSNTSVLSSSLNFSNGIGIKLASKSASSKNLSIATTYQNDNFLLQSAFFEDSQILASASYKKNFSGFAKLNTLLTYSKFIVNSKMQSTWYKTFPTFTTDTKNAFYIESLLSIPLLQTKVSTGIIENPFNQIRYFFTTESFFHYANYSFGIGFFANDSFFNKYKLPIITTSSDLEKCIYQIKINPQFEYKSDNNFYLKSGICGFYDYSVLQDNFNEQEKININAETDFLFKNNKISLLYKMQNFISPESKHTASIKYNRYAQKLNFSTFCKAEFLPYQDFYKSEKSQSFGISIYPKKSPISYFSLYSTFTEKESNVTPALNCTISTDFSYKKVKLTGKIQLKTTLLVE